MTTTMTHRTNTTGNRSKTRRLLSRGCLPLLATGLLGLTPVAADEYTWSGLGSDSAWDTAGNWDGNIVPASGSDILFDGNTGLTTTLAAGSVTTAGTITFASTATSARTLSPGSSSSVLLLTSGLNKVAGSGTTYINSLVRLGAKNVWTGTSTGSLVASRGVDLNGYTLDLQGVGVYQIGGSGYAALTGGSSTVLYTNLNGTTAINSSSNDFTGSVVARGVLQLKETNAAGVNNNLYMRNYANVRTYGTGANQDITISSTIRVEASGRYLGASQGSSTASLTHTYSGDVIFNTGEASTLTLFAHSSTEGVVTTLNFDGDISDLGDSVGSLTTAASGTGSTQVNPTSIINLNGTNTYGGTTTVIAGTFNVNGSLGNSNITVGLSSGASSTFGGTGTLHFNLSDSEGSDLITVRTTGTLDISDLTLALVADDVQVGTQYTIVDNSTGGTIVGSSFSAVTVDAGYEYDISYGSDAITLTFTQVPEHSTTALLFGLVGVGMLAIRLKRRLARA